MTARVPRQKESLTIGAELKVDPGDLANGARVNMQSMLHVRALRHSIEGT